MVSELSIRICGEAGQGTQTIGQVLSLMCQNAHLRLFAHQDFMSRIRGGNNFFQIRISSRPVYAARSRCEIIVCLDKASPALHASALAADGLLIADQKKFGPVNLPETVPGAILDAPLYDLAMEKGGKDIFVNAVACGMIAGIMELDVSCVEKALRGTFSDKSPEIVDINIACARSGYEFAGRERRNGLYSVEPGDTRERSVVSGSEAVALGAIRAGCKFYSAYPMSPSTGVMNEIAARAKEFDIIVEQAEDEIAAVNMVIGASFAGVRSMTSTSGGGFCLMVEGLSLAGMTETPLVILDAQRPGPATGFPTRTEQADLDFILAAGHGEFGRVIYTPGTVEELYSLTARAFNTAEKFQVPVIIMSDQLLADSVRDIAPLDPGVKIERGLISREASKKVAGYKRYALTENGVSPRAVPSWVADPVYADSDEHNEEGHITEDALMRVRMVEKRYHKRMRLLSQEAVKPVSENIAGAHVILIGCGSVYGVMKEAAHAGGSGRERVGFIHLPQVWPFPAQEMAYLLNDARRIVTVENNAGAQLAKLLRRETGIKVSDSILKYDGRPFTVDELFHQLIA
ncbi:MAG TPA: 2-oxoacid:acceptor oxidoreductase subunit alpha [Candidatus Omnitrophota bacterium]|nr:2-oxoacid:acceptor oxidoreductase subunit alpha [Candidatus Omnitrophota bacterium]HRZ14124.1 2-oxoacid:acceptor oxidoreductase subunit alpha [Candidatus Omnitrophota bacterium]